MKIDADEKELLESVERGEWKSAGGGKRERARLSRYAKATFKKDRRLNIRLSSKDLEAIQKRALAEGLPYQTPIASLLHKYAALAPQKDLKSGPHEAAAQNVDARGRHAVERAWNGCGGMSLTREHSMARLTVVPRGSRLPLTRQRLARFPHSGSSTSRSGRRVHQANSVRNL